MAGAIIYKFVSESNFSDEKWFKLIRVAVILQILASLPQPWGFNPIMKIVGLFTTVKENLPGHLVGTLGNRNYLAAFIAISIPLFIGWKTFKFKGISINSAIIGIFIFLFFCFSPGTLAAVMGISFLIFYKESHAKRILAFILTTLICASYTVFYVLSTGNHAWEFTALPEQLKELIFTGKITLDPFKGDIGRFGMWMLAFSKLIKHWFFFIFGYGPGAFWGREYSIHGEYISVWFQFGLIGLGLMIGYIYTTWKFLAKEKSIILLSSFLIICLDMIGNFPMEIASTAFMIVIICGLIERKRLNGGLSHV